MSCGGLLALLALVLVFSVPAEAAVRAKPDRRNEIRFELDGRTLTATIVDRPSFIQVPSLESKLWGRRVMLGCGTSFRYFRRGTMVGRVHRWPRGALSLSVRLGRDISRGVKWCLLEERGRWGGADIAWVSFRSAEPGRRLTAGTFGDGTTWRLIAWRGNQLQPCLGLRLPDQGRFGTYCFEDEAETEAGIEADFVVVTCTGETMVLGATSRAAATVTVRRADRSAVAATLYRRPRGSRVRAQYFAAVLPEPVDVASAEWPDIASVEAHDSQGRLIARDRGINGSGPDCESADP